MGRSARRGRRAFWAVVALVTLGFDYSGPPERYWAYFTHLANLAIALWFVAGALAPRWAEGRAALRLTITLAGLLTCGVYWTLLAPTSHPVGTAAVTNAFVHGVIPAAMVGEGLLVPGPRPPRWAPWAVVTFPLVYLGFCLVGGLATGWYPYAFLDPRTAGWGSVVGTVGALTIGFLAGAALWTAGVERLRVRRRAKGEGTPPSTGRRG